MESKEQKIHSLYESLNNYYGDQLKINIDWKFLNNLIDDDVKYFKECEDDRHVGSLIMFYYDDIAEYLSLLEKMRAANQLVLRQYFLGFDFDNGSELNRPICFIWRYIGGDSIRDQLDKYCEIISNVFQRKFCDAFFSSDYIDPPCLAMWIIEGNYNDDLPDILKKYNVTGKEFDYLQFEEWAADFADGN